MAVPLTAYPGLSLQPAFSPDGHEVVFSWNGEKQDHYEIYRKLIGQGEPLRLNTGPLGGYSPAWSPDGQWLACGGKSITFLMKAERRAITRL